MVNQLENLLSVGHLVQKCKDDIRSTLDQLKALYKPCTPDNINEFTGDLIEVLNKVCADFVEENIPETEKTPVIKYEDFTQDVIIAEEIDQQLLKPGISQNVSRLNVEVVKYPSEREKIPAIKLENKQDISIVIDSDVEENIPEIEENPVIKLKKPENKPNIFIILDSDEETATEKDDQLSESNESKSGGFPSIVMVKSIANNVHDLKIDGRSAEIIRSKK